MNTIFFLFLSELYNNIVRVSEKNSNKLLGGVE